MTKKTEKKYSLSKSEKEMLDKQTDMITQYEYMLSLLKTARFAHLRTIAKHRLGVNEEENLHYDPESNTISILPEEKKIGTKEAK